MTNALTTFKNEALDASIRVLDREGEPWFVAKDVCQTLGLSNPSVAIRPLMFTEWAKENLAQRGMGAAIIISESGLYKLIMRSNKVEAKPFQNWVTRDVLPAIRKDGSYVMGEEKVMTGEMSVEDLTKAFAASFQTKIDRLTKELESMTARAVAAETKLGEAEGTAEVLSSVVGQHAHSLQRYARTLPGVNCNKIKQSLLKLRYLYRKGGTYRVYSKFSHLFPEKFNDQYGTVDVFVSDIGKVLLADLKRDRKLIMKAGWA